MFSLELPHRGDSNENTQYTCTITCINIKRKITQICPKYNNVRSYGIFLLGTQGRVPKSRGR